MSPNSARKAEQLGYTNVKVYHEGLPEWSKNNFSVVSARSYKEGWIDKDIPAVVLDIRPSEAVKKGFIKGAVSLPSGEIEKSIARFPKKDMKPPVIIYSDKSGDDAAKTAKILNAAGYKNTKVLLGGISSWQEAGYDLERGTLNTAITYAPKPRPGEITIDEFKSIAANAPADTLILDVRNDDEGEKGMIKGARLVPDDEILERLAEIPKDKKIVTHCSTGVRAEMAYHNLKEKGYNVSFLNATIKVDEKGNFTIEKP